MGGLWQPRNRKTRAHIRQRQGSLAVDLRARDGRSGFGVAPESFLRRAGHARSIRFRCGSFDSVRCDMRFQYVHHLRVALRGRAAQHTIVVRMYIGASSKQYIHRLRVPIICRPAQRTIAFSMYIGAVSEQHFYRFRIAVCGRPAQRTIVAYMHICADDEQRLHHLRMANIHCLDQTDIQVRLLLWEKLFRLFHGSLSPMVVSVSTHSPLPRRFESNSTFFVSIKKSKKVALRTMETK